MSDCIFCDIISKDISAYIVAEDEYCMAILPKEMETKAHTIIFPKKHSENIFGTDYETFSNIFSFIQEISRKYQDWLWSIGLNILNANWEGAQQSVPHLHFHIIPRFKSDGLNARPSFPQILLDKNSEYHEIIEKCFPKTKKQ